MRFFWGQRPPPIARAKPSPGSVRVLSNPGVSYLLDRRDAGGESPDPRGAHPDDRLEQVVTAFGHVRLK
jgi:hypothetical protein